MDKTKAIVLNKIKYSDSSIIVRCFTRDFGMKNYLVKGAYNPKNKFKIGYFQPLHLLKISSKHRSNKNLHYLESVEMEKIYKTMYEDFSKQSLAFFIAEILYESLKDPENIHKEFYDYTILALEWLDLHTKIQNFHLVFLLKITRYLGFYPNITEGNAFNLETGRSENKAFGKYILEGEPLKNFFKIYENNLQTLEKIKLKPSERTELLEILIRYFSLHLPNFKRPKSLKILQTIFKNEK